MKYPYPVRRNCKVPLTENINYNIFGLRAAIKQGEFTIAVNAVPEQTIAEHSVINQEM